MVRSNDRPAMTIAVDLGRKATNKQTRHLTFANQSPKNSCTICLSPDQYSGTERLATNHRLLGHSLQQSLRKFPRLFKTACLVVRAFSDILVAFLYFVYATTVVSGKYQNMVLWKSHLNIRESSDTCLVDCKNLPDQPRVHQADAI